MTESEELPAVFIRATAGMQCIWCNRVNKKQVTIQQMRSEIEAKILLKSRYREAK